MPTTAGGYPYPNPTDPAAAGADNIKALADAVQLRLRTSAGGTTPLVVAAGSAFQQAAVTFPVGRFTAPPSVAVSSQANTFIAGCSSISAASCNVFCRHYTGATTGGTVPVGWIATVAG